MEQINNLRAISVTKYLNDCCDKQAFRNELKRIAARVISENITNVKERERLIMKIKATPAPTSLSQYLLQEFSK